MRIRTTIIAVTILAAVVSYGGYGLLSARKIMLASKGNRQVLIVQSAMTVLGVPEYWQKRYLNVHYPKSSSFLEENSSQSTTPKYAYVTPRP